MQIVETNRNKLYKHLFDLEMQKSFRGYRKSFKNFETNIYPWYFQQFLQQFLLLPPQLVQIRFLVKISYCLLKLRIKISLIIYSTTGSSADPTTNSEFRSLRIFTNLITNKKNLIVFVILIGKNEIRNSLSDSMNSLY